MKELALCALVIVLGAAVALELPAGMELRYEIERQANTVFLRKLCIEALSQRSSLAVE